MKVAKRAVSTGRAVSRGVSSKAAGKTTRKGSSGGVVLPKASSKAGGRTIHSVDQLLTSKQRKVLRDDLSDMARRRRQAEASSSTLKLS